ncbi:hypothetical protein H4582DRAFT_2052301 [Lactarius indigo]|nr:hypothetical protein H4582DRAFT_2052301 [Lactarius indigo]
MYRPEASPLHEIWDIYPRNRLQPLALNRPSSHLAVVVKWSTEEPRQKRRTKAKRAQHRHHDHPDTGITVDLSTLPEAASTKMKRRCVLSALKVFLSTAAEVRERVISDQFSLCIQAPNQPNYPMEDFPHRQGHTTAADLISRSHAYQPNYLMGFSRVSYYRSTTGNAPGILSDCSERSETTLPRVLKRSRLSRPVSSTVVDPRPTIFPNALTNQYEVNATAEYYSCAACTGSTSNGPPTWDTMGHQDRNARPSSDTYTNQGQGINNPIGAPPATPVLAQAQFDVPGVQQQEDHAPSQATAGTHITLAVVWPCQGPNIRISEAEVLRRLADRYVNNPGSLVSVVRLEPGPSGGFQVVIMLEMADLF